MLLAGVIFVAVDDVGVFVPTTVGVVVDIVVVRIVCVNVIVGGEQGRCACILVGFIIAVVFSTAFVVSFFSDIAMVVGGVSGTVCCAINFIHVSSESIEIAVGVLRVEVPCVVLNVGVQHL